MSTTTYTAVRTWNRPHTKATVTLFENGVEIDRAGGARAGRAQAVIVTQWRVRRYNAEGGIELGDLKPAGIYGLRGDAHAAQVEAVRLGEARNVKSGRHGNYTTTPADLAIAVIITEEEN
jgi:hypothetical protein